MNFEKYWEALEKALLKTDQRIKKLEKHKESASISETVIQTIM
ncbi:MAG: hypothetical protein OEY17_03750 [Nitrosopumilus sp.]|nr:hypothetical protein [Nitrosopumilus sp.]MDH5658441.1 hypothetical protein [Nitrosopumilus sp.]